MNASPSEFADELGAAVEEYRVHGNAAQLRRQLHDFASRRTPDAIVVASEPYRDEPDITAPLYEIVVEAQPDNARALVILANAYWLLGLGPDVVGALANRAVGSDPSNRGAWHLWALTESDPRQRVVRWQQVTERFSGDDLALANVADNAAGVAGAEQDYEMLDLAINAYEQLLRRSEVPAQRDALETALRALRGWKF